MENELKVLELLERIEVNSRKQRTFAKLQFVLTIISAVCCVMLLLAILTIVPQVQEMIAKAESVLVNLETVTSELANTDLTGMVEGINTLVGNVDSLVGASESSIMEAMDNINNIDFDALNGAIGDLSEVIEPIAKFFKTFKLG